MKDATDYFTDRDKAREERTYMVAMTYDEVWALKGLAQNPHPAHMDDQLTVPVKSLFYGAKAILERVACVEREGEARSHDGRWRY